MKTTWKKKKSHLNRILTNCFTKISRYHWNVSCLLYYRNVNIRMSHAYLSDIPFRTCLLHSLYVCMYVCVSLYVCVIYVYMCVYVSACVCPSSIYIISLGILTEQHKQHSKTNWISLIAVLPCVAFVCV